MAGWSRLHVHLCAAVMLTTQWQHHDSKSTQSQTSSELLDTSRSTACPSLPGCVTCIGPVLHSGSILSSSGAASGAWAGTGAPQLSQIQLILSAVWGDLWGLGVLGSEQGYKRRDGVSCRIEVVEGGGHRHTPRITFLWGAPKPSSKSRAPEDEGTQGTKRVSTSPLTVPVDHWPQSFPSEESAFDQSLLFFHCHGHKGLTQC